MWRDVKVDIKSAKRRKYKKGGKRAIQATRNRSPSTQDKKNRKGSQKRINWTDKRTTKVTGKTSSPSIIKGDKRAKNDTVIYSSSPGNYKDKRTIRVTAKGRSPKAWIKKLDRGTIKVTVICWSHTGIDSSTHILVAWIVPLFFLLVFYKTWNGQKLHIGFGCEYIKQSNGRSCQ